LITSIGIAPFKKTGKSLCPLLFFILFLFGAGCGESFYDSGKLASAGDHLGHINSKVDLFWALHQHGFDKAVVAGCRPSRLYPDQEDTAKEIERINKVGLALAKGAPDIIYAMPMIDIDDPDPLKTATEYLVNGKGYGVSLDPLPGQEIFSKKMRKVYAACELGRAPVYLHFDKDRFSDLKKLAGDYPNLILIASQMAGMHDDLPALRSLLWQHNNIYLGFGFGPEEVLLNKMDDLAKDMEGLLLFIKDHKERICFSTETNLTEAPYRNSALAESQVRFTRRFLEKETALIKIKSQNEKWIEREYPGLSLDKQTLGYIYRFNFDRAFSRTRPDISSYNLDLLITDFEKGAIYDPESELRLVPVVVANNNRTLTGLSSSQIRKLLSGAATDFGQISGEIKLVSRGPIAHWLARLLKVKTNVSVKRIDDPEKFTDFILKNRSAIGFCSFGDLSAKLRCLKIDGESPALSYIKYCAGKGSGKYEYYFNTYPLLIPISFPDKSKRNRFFPHELRSFVISGPATFGPIEKNKETINAAMHPTNDVAPYYRDAGIALLPFKGDITENCHGDDCTDSKYMPGILATGLDAYIGKSGGERKFFDPHGIFEIGPGHPVTRDVRGMLMTLVGGRVQPGDLGKLVLDIKVARKKGALVAAAVWVDKEDFDKIASVFTKAGVKVVVNVNGLELAPWSINGDKVTVAGMGPSFLPKSKDGKGMLLTLTFYKDKFIAIEPVMIESGNGATRKLSGSRAADAMKTIITKVD